MSRTGLVYHEKMLAHDAGLGHPERPARLEAILKALEAAGVKAAKEPIEAVPAERADLLRVHSAEHVSTIEEVCSSGGYYPCPDTGMCAASWDAALLAAGGVIRACRGVLDGELENAFCAVRPPGHHAERDRAMGFCLFNNVAVAARWLRDVRRLERVAILDWDVHHGNGTQNAFYDDATVYYASMHQFPHYPGTGRADQRGAENTNLNIPLPPGSGPDLWLDALEARILPEFRRFKPDFLLVSAGFDAHRLDPLSHQLLETETYAEMTGLLEGLADGRVVSALEGGYDLGSLAASAVAHVRALEAFR